MSYYSTENMKWLMENGHEEEAYEIYDALSDARCMAGEFDDE